MLRMLNFFTNNFLAWTVLGGAAALFYPPLFTWFRQPFISIGLGIIMLGMGITLRGEDFKRIFEMPRQVFAGLLLQYTIMPALGYSIGYLMDLPAHYAVGLVLVSCCPGGTASNVITFLARANVALSVTMTAVSTMLAIVLTPLLTELLAGNRMEVDGFGLFLSALQVVLLPVALGVVLNRYLPRLTARVQPFAPAVAVLLIILIVGSILGSVREQLIVEGQMAAGIGNLIASVVALHLFGFILGYLFARIMVRDEIASRTISIEVGMQNSGLGTVLAKSNFTNPLVPVPSVISAVCHCILGSIAAAVWRRRAAPDILGMSAELDK